MSYTGDDIGGVGGWLAFFVIVMGVFTPLAMIGGNAADLYGDPSVAAAYGSAWSSIQAAIWGSIAVGVAICWFICYRLMRVERWSTVQLTIVGIWLLAIGLNGFQLLMLSFLSGISIADFVSVTVVELVRGIIFAMVWTSYFLLSKRVANTYRRAPEGEDLAERFA